MPTERDYTLPPFKNRVSQAAKEASRNIFSKTKTRIQEKEREIKWRYGKVPLEPFLFPKNSFMNALSLVFFQWLGNRGFGRYVKTGYTMVLEKIK